MIYCMKLNPTREIIFNQLLLEYAPGSLLPKLPCSQACLLPAVISGVTPTQHDFAFAVKNDVVPLGPLLELAVLFLAGCIHQRFSLAQTTSVLCWLGSKYIRPLKVLIHWRNLKICALRLPTPSSVPRE